MPLHDQYAQQVQLLVDVLPYVAQEPCFVLKGGTAINLFVRDLPRLSVDIDLAYLPLKSRAEALAEARAALARIASRVSARIPGVQARQDLNREDSLRVVVARQRTEIKLEVSPVLRGALHPPVIRDAMPLTQEQFGFVSLPVLAMPDLYGGKLCAALDRQHPRDWFDVKLLLDAGELTREVFEGFLTYLISHGRPMHELLGARWKPLEAVFKNQFEGMTRQHLTLEELEATREQLLSRLKTLMTARDKAFLISIKHGQPDWTLFAHPEVAALPAVQWKLQNVRKMRPAQRTEAIRRLRSTLDQYGEMRSGTTT
jgi:predicted nucleotidyltransferase component of viral defense system